MFSTSADQIAVQLGLKPSVVRHIHTLLNKLKEEPNIAVLQEYTRLGSFAYPQPFSPGTLFELVGDSWNVAEVILAMRFTNEFVSRALHQGAARPIVPDPDLRSTVLTKFVVMRSILDNILRSVAESVGPLKHLDLQKEEMTVLLELMIHPSERIALLYDWSLYSRIHRGSKKNLNTTPLFRKVALEAKRYADMIGRTSQENLPKPWAPPTSIQQTYLAEFSRLATDEGESVDFGTLDVRYDCFTHVAEHLVEKTRTIISAPETASFVDLEEPIQEILEKVDIRRRPNQALRSFANILIAMDDDHVLGEAANDFDDQIGLTERLLSRTDVQSDPKLTELLAYGLRCLRGTKARHEEAVRKVAATLDLEAEETSPADIVMEEAEAEETERRQESAEPGVVDLTVETANNPWGYRTCGNPKHLRFPTVSPPLHVVHMSVFDFLHSLVGSPLVACFEDGLFLGDLPYFLGGYPWDNVDFACGVAKREATFNIEGTSIKAFCVRVLYAIKEVFSKTRMTVALWCSLEEAAFLTRNASKVFPEEEFCMWHMVKDKYRSPAMARKNRNATISAVEHLFVLFLGHPTPDIRYNHHGGNRLNHLIRPWTMPTILDDRGRAWNACEKPLPILEHIITTFAGKQKVVIDAFGGTGSASHVAAVLGHPSIYIEKDRTQIGSFLDRAARFFPLQHPVWGSLSNPVETEEGLREWMEGYPELLVGYRRSATAVAMADIALPSASEEEEASEAEDDTQPSSSKKGPKRRRLVRKSKAAKAQDVVPTAVEASQTPAAPATEATMEPMVMDAPANMTSEPEPSPAPSTDVAAPADLSASNDDPGAPVPQQGAASSQDISELERMISEGIAAGEVFATRSVPVRKSRRYQDRP